MWVSWLREFADGELGGGSFWQGRDSVSFGPGYQLKSGATTAHKDAVARPTFNDGEKLITPELLDVATQAYTLARGR